MRALLVVIGRGRRRSARLYRLQFAQQHPPSPFRKTGAVTGRVPARLGSACRRQSGRPFSTPWAPGLQISTPTFLLLELRLFFLFFFIRPCISLPPAWGQIPGHSQGCLFRAYNHTRGVVRRARSRSMFESPKCQSWMQS